MGAAAPVELDPPLDSVADRESDAVTDVRVSVPGESDLSFLHDAADSFGLPVVRPFVDKYVPPEESEPSPTPVPVPEEPLPAVPEEIITEKPKNLADYLPAEEVQEEDWVQALSKKIANDVAEDERVTEAMLEKDYDVGNVDGFHLDSRRPSKNEDI